MAHDEQVKQHLRSTVALFRTAMVEMAAQVSPDAGAAVAAAIAAGSSAKITTRISLSGEVDVVIDLVAPDGEVVNLGCIGLDGSGAMLN